MAIEPWAVHELTYRPADDGAMLCSCAGCNEALDVTAQTRRDFVLGIKTNCDRILVTAEYFVEAMHEDPSLRTLMYVEGDWVRGVYVPVGAPPLDAGRWWSQTCHADAA